VIKLTRKTEYGLLALRYLHQRSHGHVASARDIALHYKIPNEVLAKVMQELKKNSLVVSIKGVHGGYSLSQSLDQVSFLDFLRIFADDTALVDCLSHAPVECHQLTCCDIRGPLSVLNAVIQQQFAMLTLHSLFNLPQSTGVNVPAAVLGSSKA
jgi:Rrf2 family protein